MRSYTHGGWAHRQRVSTILSWNKLGYSWRGLSSGQMETIGSWVRPSTNWATPSPPVGKIKENGPKILKKLEREVEWRVRFRKWSFARSMQSTPFVVWLTFAICPHCIDVRCRGLIKTWGRGEGAGGALYVTRSDKRVITSLGRSRDNWRMKTSPRGHFINLLFLILSHCTAFLFYHILTAHSPFWLLNDFKTHFQMIKVYFD